MYQVLDMAVRASRDKDNYLIIMLIRKFSRENVVP
jgi:hypothetical protein